MMEPLFRFVDGVGTVKMDKILDRQEWALDHFIIKHLPDRPHLGLRLAASAFPS